MDNMRACNSIFEGRQHLEIYTKTKSLYGANRHSHSAVVEGCNKFRQVRESR